MKLDDVGQEGSLAPSPSLEGRLEAAERLCGQLRQRVTLLEREREDVRRRLESILGLLDGMMPG